MLLLAGVFLCDLEFDRFVAAAQSGKQRRRRFAHLKINRSVLDLDDGVVIELAIKRMKIVVGGLGAVVFQIAPVEMVVIDEGAIENDASMRLQSASHHVGGVGVSAAIRRRAGTALRIGFDEESAQVGNVAVDFVYFLAPPIGNARIKRIEGV